MKYSIAQSQIVTEFAEAGNFSVVSYDAETGKRRGTICGCNLHRAMAELVNLVNRGNRKVLVFSNPTRDDMLDLEEAMQSPDLASFEPYTFGSKPFNRRRR